MQPLPLDTPPGLSGIAAYWFRVIDAEATSNNPEVDQPIEVAYQDVSGTGQKGGKFVSLVNPGMPISPLASAVHHLIDSDVERSPQYQDVRPMLLRPMPDGREPIFVAHNAEFDQHVLKLPGVVICTYRLAKHLWPELQGHGNEQVRYQLKLEPDFPRGSSHRAEADVATTVVILLAALPLVRERWPDVQTPAQLAARVAQPCVLHCVPFGEPRGRLFTDETQVDDGLLHWILRKQAGGDDCVFTAQHELDRRSEERLARFRRPIGPASAGPLGDEEPF